jgi:hypothetical protein
LPLYRDVLNEHEQLFQASCIPMAIEFVLKLLGKLRPEDFILQAAWDNRTNGNFADFDERTFNGVKFRRQFPNPRDDDFPLNDLFETIEDELASRRYVIVSLAVEGGHWHNYIIHNRLQNGQFEAVTKGRDPERINDVKQRIETMKGTDILTYELLSSTAGIP